MFLRFRASFRDNEGVRHSGIFQAAAYIRNNELAHPDDDYLFHCLKDWFNENLEPPSQFTKRRTGKYSGTAIGWYRDTAKDHLKKMYELASLLEKYGVITEVVRREDPGYVVYEDEYQVAAIPYRGDRESVI